MLHKIPLKTEIFDHSSLTAQVQLWLNRTDISFFIQKHQFKYFPFFVNTLPNNFISAAIVYSIKKRLPGLSRDSEHSLVELSQCLKEHYSCLNMGPMKNKDMSFYFLCVYLTKMAVTFLEDLFIDLQVESHLEAEIYITLVHVMIGIEVCPKSYELNHQKIIKKRSTVVTISKNYALNKCEPLDAVSMDKLSQKKINYLGTPTRKLLAKKTLSRKCTQDVSRQEISTVDQFRQTLKENLAIKILPRLPPKLIKASQFDHTTELSLAAKEGDEKKFLFTTREKEIIKKPTNYLNSTQNSSAFEMMLRKNNQSPQSMHRTVKISHRPQLVKHKRATLTPTPNAYQDYSASQNSVKYQNGKKDWDVVMRELKKHVNTNSKHSMTRKWLDIGTQTPESSIDNNQQEQKVKEKIQIKKQSTGESKSPEVKDKKEDQQEPGKVRHFAYWINQQQKRAESQQIKEVIPDSHQFRKLKKQFDTQCLDRQQEANYSMFNLNTTFSFFRTFLR